ncbi:MAG TPA: hypothetical protein VGK32_05500 [Vicinamibacterales bacterium]|jgi:hypothetical protein
MLAIALAILFSQASTAQKSAVADVRLLTVSAPRILAELDTTKAQGDPIGLAWRSDGAIYLRVAQGKDKVRHYQISTSPTLSIGQTDGTPEWAATYWVWKSAVVAPGDPALKIDVEQRKTNAKLTNTSSGGELAGMGSAAAGGAGGESMSQATAIMASNNTTTSDVITMRLKGHVVGEWVNEAPLPGVRFGWAPAPMGVLAYVDADGRLALLDREGHKAPVGGTVNATLPAWSQDGLQIVYLQKKNQKLYLLMIADVR